MSAVVAAAAKAGRIKDPILKSRKGLDEYKRQTIFEHIIAHGFTPIQKRLVDLKDTSTIINFDGTDDVIVPKSDPRLIPIIGVRYNSDIDFHRFEFRMKRRNNAYWGDSDLKRLAGTFISLAVGLSQKEKILVVCWKTVKLVTKNTGEADTYEAPVTTDIAFPERLLRVLVEAGGKEENIGIIYRGSGLERSCNDYRDFSTIFFLGSWALPSEPIRSQIAEMYGLPRLDFRDYMLALTIQSICRIRIRHHAGLPISVYFSSDIDYNLAYDVQEYFKAESSPACKIGGLLKPCRKLSKPDKRFLYYMTRLYTIRPLIRSSIESGTSYSFDISLTDLYNLVPISKRKAKDRYKTFKKFLAGLGIYMTITNP